jgi:hypothetical protein
VTLPRFKLRDLAPGGFSISTGFGWDIGPGNRLDPDMDPQEEVWPREHLATDVLAKGDMQFPYAVDNAAWIDRDRQGCSCLRLIKDMSELRILHINKSEFDSQTMAAVVAPSTPIAKGAHIGPCGNTGISFGLNGGRHAHVQFLACSGAYDKELTDRFGDFWKQNHMKELSSLYGEKFDAQIEKRGITSVNQLAIVKKDDPYWGREMVALNIQLVFE